MNTRWAPRLRVAVAILVFTALVVFAWSAGRQQGNARDDQLRASQVEGCERGNLLRYAVNDLTFVMQDFLQSAATAREATGTPIDLVTADRYRSLAGQIAPLEVPDCEATVAE